MREPIGYAHPQGRNGRRRSDSDIRRLRSQSVPVTDLVGASVSVDIRNPVSLD
jgi:hypothetical protein